MQYWTAQEHFMQVLIMTFEHILQALGLQSHSGVYLLGSKHNRLPDPVLFDPPVAWVS